MLRQHLDPAQRVVGIRVGGLGEVDRHPVGPVGRDAGQRQPELVDRRAVQRGVERVDDVGAGERRAIGPFHAMPKLHRDRPATVGPGIASAQPGLDRS